MTNPNDAEVLKRLESLTPQQKARLKQIIEQVRPTVHGNSQAWEQIDWNQMIDAVIEAVPYIPPPEYMATLRTLGINPYEHLTLADLNVEHTTNEAMKALPHITNNDLLAYLMHLPDAVLHLMQNTLESIPRSRPRLNRATHPKTRKACK